MTAMPTRRVFAILLLAGAVLAVNLVACSSGRAALGFAPDKLQNGTVGQPYEAVIAVINNDTPVGDMYVSSGSLPPGVTLNFTRGTSASGTISGTPTTAGTYVFAISAWCLGTNVSGQSGEQSYSLVVD